MINFLKVPPTLIPSNLFNSTPVVCASCLIKKRKATTNNIRFFQAFLNRKMSIFLSNFQSIVRAWNLQMQKNKNIGLTHPKQNTAQKQSPTKHLLLCTSL